MQVKIDSGSNIDLDSAYTIQSSDVTAGTKTLSVSSGVLEAVSGFGDGVVVTFLAVLTDSAGNETSGTVSTTTLTVDQTLPSAFTTGAVTTVGGTVVAGYWNNTNTSLTVGVPIANDSTLTGGTVQLRVKVNSGTFINLNSAYTIVSGNLNNTITRTVTAAEIEAIADFAMA